MASSIFKTEPDIHLTNGETLKVETEINSGAASPLAQSDEDRYEDAGDLDFSGTIHGLYLARIPRFLWDTWAKLDDDHEIQLGIVRVEGGSSDPKRVRHDYCDQLIVLARASRNIN